MILGSFTNGTKVPGQIALVNFSNLEDLLSAGHNCFTSTLPRGRRWQVRRGRADAGCYPAAPWSCQTWISRASLRGWILAQRGFEANAYMIYWRGAEVTVGDAIGTFAGNQFIGGGTGDSGEPEHHPSSCKVIVIDVRIGRH